MAHGAPGVVNLSPSVYDFVARWFVMRGQEQRFRDMAADLAGIRPGDAVLDVGCGTGTMALTAKRRVGEGGRVIGIDPSPRLLAGARRKARKAGLLVDFRQAGIERLDLPDASLDVAMGTFMLHHLPAEVARSGIAELCRVVRPGGRVLMIDFSHPGGHGADGVGLTEFAGILAAGDFTVDRGTMPFRIRSFNSAHREYGYVLGVRAEAA